MENDSARKSKTKNEIKHSLDENLSNFYPKTYDRSLVLDRVPMPLTQLDESKVQAHSSAVYLFTSHTDLIFSSVGTKAPTNIQCCRCKIKNFEGL